MLASNAGIPQGTLMKIENDTNTASCPDYYPRARLGKPAKWLQKEWFQIKIKNNNHIGKALALPWRVMDFRSVATDDGFKEGITSNKTLRVYAMKILVLCKYLIQVFQICDKETDTLRDEMTFLRSCGWLRQDLTSAGTQATWY